MVKGSGTDVGGIEGAGKGMMSSGMRNQQGASGDVLPTNTNPDIIAEEFDAFSFTSQPSAQSMLYDGYELGLDGTIADVADATTSGSHISWTAFRSRQLPDSDDLLSIP